MTVKPVTVAVLKFRGGYRGGPTRVGGGGTGTNNQKGEGMCPLPREARKLLGVPLLATQTQYFEALNWGERLKNGGKLRGGGGGGGGGNCVS